MSLPPLLRNKVHRRAAVFTPENLLREARRQKRLAKGKVPEICVLDSDGDLVRHLRRTSAAERSAAWACYHTELYEFSAGGKRLGVVGCAVGAPFAVLGAEDCMARSKGDFEKGEAGGSVAVLCLLGRIAEEWRKNGGKVLAG